MITIDTECSNVACIYTNNAEPLGYTCTMRFLAYSRDMDSLNVTGVHLTGKCDDDVIRVVITQSGILYVPSPMFDIFLNIETVEIDNAGLQKLNINSFRNADKLTKFKSYRNKLQRIDARAFYAIEALEKLELDANIVEEIDENAFEGLDKLKTLC